LHKMSGKKKPRKKKSSRGDQEANLSGKGGCKKEKKTATGAMEEEEEEWFAMRLCKPSMSRPRKAGLLNALSGERRIRTKAKQSTASKRKKKS